LQPRTDSISSTIVNQLQPTLARAVSTHEPLSILLRPPELGAVRIDITQHAGFLTARLEAESPVAHRLLIESLPQLRDVLTPLGVAPDQIQVLRMDSPSAWETGRPADAHADAGGSRQNQDAPPHHSAEPDGIEEPERDDRSTPIVQSRTAINLKI
jgi:flagellar hook-length control protein FliK